MTEDDEDVIDLDGIAEEFVAGLSGDRFRMGSILSGGLAFTTYEDELEARVGEGPLLELKLLIYTKLRNALMETRIR